MTKAFSISLSDYVYETYLLELPNKNRSQYIEKLIVLGAEVELGSQENIKAKLIKAHTQIKELQEQLNKIKQEIGRKKSKKKKTYNAHNDWDL